MSIMTFNSPFTSMMANEKYRQLQELAKRGELDESLDLRDLVREEVEYRGLDSSVVDKAIHDIKNSDRLMQILDMVVNEAVSFYE